MTKEKKYYIFKKVVESPYRIEHIYPIKQRDLVYILEHLPPEVEKVYVFGSSLTLDCGVESDIDLLVIGPKTDEVYKAFSKVFKMIGTEIDVIFKSEEEYRANLLDQTSICSVVEREGLLIYERAL